MANSISLVPYVARIKKSHERDFLMTDSLPDGLDLFKLLEEYLKERKGDSSLDEEAKTGIKVEDTFNHGQRVVDGLFMTGKYGYEAELENIETGKIKSRDVNDCEFMPFFFYGEFPKNVMQGLMFFQRFGVFGTKGIFERDFNEFLKEKNPDLIFRLNPIVSKKRVDELIGGSIKQIRFVQYQVPEDVADRLDLGDLGEEAYLETTIKTSRDQFLGMPKWLKDIYQGKVDIGEFIEVKEVKYDEIKIEVEVNGKYKTVDLRDLQKLRMSIDITPDIKLGKNGHPTLPSLRAAMDELLPEFRKTVGW